MSDNPHPPACNQTADDGFMAAIMQRTPYLRFLGIGFEPDDGGLTAILPFQDRLIGNPQLQALHGGVIAGFLEVTAAVTLADAAHRRATPDGSALEGGANAGQSAPTGAPHLPLLIDLTIDYLRAGQRRPTCARAKILHAGRRYASVHVVAWQEDRDRPIAQATTHFLMQDRHD